MFVLGVCSSLLSVCVAGQGLVNVVRVLLDLGASTELCTNSGETALLKVSIISAVGEWSLISSSLACWAHCLCDVAVCLCLLLVCSPNITVNFVIESRAENLPVEGWASLQCLMCMCLGREEWKLWCRRIVVESQCKLCRDISRWFHCCNSRTSGPALGYLCSYLWSHPSVRLFDSTVGRHWVFSVLWVVSAIYWVVCECC